LPTALRLMLNKCLNTLSIVYCTVSLIHYFSKVILTCIFIGNFSWRTRIYSCWKAFIKKKLG